MPMVSGSILSIDFQTIMSRVHKLTPLSSQSRVPQDMKGSSRLISRPPFPKYSSTFTYKGFYSVSIRDPRPML